MTPERVYALLVEANPVPDPDEFLEQATTGRAPLQLVVPGRTDMKTEEDIRQLTPETPQRRPWIAAVAAAIALVLAIGVVAWLAGGGNEAEVVDEPPPTTAAVETAALATTEAFLAAVEAGDIDEVARITTLDGELSLAERRDLEFTFAMVAAGYGAEIGECRAAPSADETVITVTCPHTVNDPVMLAMGITDFVVFFDYLPVSGTLQPSSTEGVDFAALNRTIVDYLTAFHPGEYAAACDPAAYGFVDVMQDRGLAFTPECAEVLIPVRSDMAKWVESGQPDPEAEALTTTAAFLDGIAAGDIEAVERAIVPGGELAPSERRMWEFNIVLAEAGYFGEIGECTTAFDTAGSRVAVRCAVTVQDPVLLAVGVNDLVMPFDYFPNDGRLAWRPFEGGDFSQANRAVADYLQAFHGTDYDAVCDPAAYGFTGIVFDQGLALTAECAQLYTPLIADIAAWIEAGRPTG